MRRERPAHRGALSPAGLDGLMRKPDRGLRGTMQHRRSGDPGGLRDRRGAARRRRTRRSGLALRSAQGARARHRPDVVGPDPGGRAGGPRRGRGLARQIAQRRVTIEEATAAAAAFVEDLPEGAAARAARLCSSRRCSSGSTASAARSSAASAATPGARPRCRTGSSRSSSSSRGSRPRPRRTSRERRGAARHARLGHPHLPRARAVADLCLRDAGPARAPRLRPRPGARGPDLKRRASGEWPARRLR